MVKCTRICSYLVNIQGGPVISFISCRLYLNICGILCTWTGRKPDPFEMYTYIWIITMNVIKGLRTKIIQFPFSVIIAYYNGFILKIVPDK